MYKFIIVDDEPLAHDIIEEFSKLIPHIRLVGQCYSAMEALQFLNHNTVDFMFLDINMPKLKGLDFLKTLSKPPKTIITSAYKDYALEGYELNVADYLLKPFSFDRFVKAVNKITDKPKENTETQQEAISLGQQHHLFVKGDKKHHRIAIEKLLFIEAYGNYTKLYLSDASMVVSHEKISDFETLLEAKQFIRVHKSFIVAIAKINYIEGNRIIIEPHKIPIGQTYKTTVNQLINKP